MSKALRGIAGWVDEHDGVLLGAVIILCLLGTVMVFEAGSPGSRPSDAGRAQLVYLNRHLGRLCVGVVALVGLAALDYRLLRRKVVIWALFGGGLALMAFAIGLRGVGEYGRSLRFGSVPLQPVEVTKLGLVLLLAERLSSPYHTFGWNRDLLRLLAPAVAVAVLLALQPNFGNVAVIGLLTLVLVFIAGMPWRMLARFFAMAAPLALFAVLFVQKLHARFSSWWRVLREGEGDYQITQSLIGLGAGGWHGFGFGASHQRFWFLPELHTDFIFSLIGEELGLIGAGVCVLLQTLVAWRGLVIASRAPDRFGRLVAVGVTALLFIYAALNMMMVSGLIPVVGVPLPFVSFGGSALVTNLAAIGILLNIDRQGRGARELRTRLARF